MPPTNPNTPPTVPIMPPTNSIGKMIPRTPAIIMVTPFLVTISIAPRIMSMMKPMITSGTMKMR